MGRLGIDIEGIVSANQYMRKAILEIDEVQREWNRLLETTDLPILRQEQFAETIQQNCILAGNVYGQMKKLVKTVEDGAYEYQMVESQLQHMGASIR